jgi:hypothetical protein
MSVVAEAANGFTARGPEDEHAAGTPSACHCSFHAGTEVKAEFWYTGLGTTTTDLLGGGIQEIVNATQFCFRNVAWYNNNSVALVRERTIPTERPRLISEATANFLWIECREVSTAGPHSRILGFIDQSRYFFF